MGLWNIYGCGIRISTILSYKENYGFRLPNLWNTKTNTGFTYGRFSLGNQSQSFHIIISILFIVNCTANEEEGKINS